MKNGKLLRIVAGYYSIIETNKYTTQKPSKNIKIKTN
jgi:hypothetical protein